VCYKQSAEHSLTLSLTISVYSPLFLPNIYRSVDRYVSLQYLLCQCLETFSLISTLFIESEKFRLEATFKGHLVKSPCNEQGHLQLRHVAQSPIQPDLECFQRWASSTSLGNLFQCFTMLNVKNFLLTKTKKLEGFSDEVCLQACIYGLFPKTFQK